MMNVVWISREQHIHASERRSLEKKGHAGEFKNLDGEVMYPVERHEQTGEHAENRQVPKQPDITFLEQQVMEDEKAKDGKESF